jgi:D-arabinan exo alpha-(1,3)/(1,5)-arabinofuranosidase (non-reducing end)
MKSGAPVRLPRRDAATSRRVYGAGPPGVRRGREAAAPTFVLVVALVTHAAATPVALAAQAESPYAGMTAELRVLHHLELLPRYRTGSVVSQISSYDTTGGNDDGFSGTYSSVRREGNARVLADLRGPGVVQRIWTPTPTDRMVAFYFDGEATARLRLPFIDLFSGKAPPFVRPVVGNEVGGYVSYLPIPYARSLKIVYEGEDIRFHQVQVRTYPANTRVESFHAPLDPAAQAQLDSVVTAWGVPEREPFPAGARTSVHRFMLAPGDSSELFRLDGGGRIVGIVLLRDGGAAWGRSVLLEARWDGEARPAVLSPVDDFFGYAFDAPSARGVLLGSEGGRDYCWLPMPFDRSGAVTLRSLPGADPVSGTATVFYATVPRDPAAEGRLYVAWRREVDPPSGEPYLIADASGRGHYVATLLQAQGLRPGMTTFFEGDDVVLIDGEMRLHGTGSEDSFNGGWYAILDRWDRSVPLPMYGALDYNLPMARTGGYRFYVGDKLSFERRLRFTIEHGPEHNDVPVDYTSVAFLYGDTPPASAMDPAKATQPRVAPTSHVFYPQLLSVSLGSGTALDHREGRLEVRAQDDGLVRIDVREVPPGRYRVRLSYFRGPDEGTFSVWRRQAQVSDWVDARADTLEHVDAADMGEVQLTSQVRSITLRTRSRDGRGVFRFDRLILDEVR